MKVLLAADFSSVHSRRYLELISSAGCEVILLEKGRFPQISGEFARRYHRWPRAGESILRYFAGRRLAEKIGSALVEIQLKLLWMRIKPDICHVQWIDDKARVLTRICVCPVILTAWGTDIRMCEFPSCDPLLRRRKSEAISKAALLIADSNDITDIAKALAQNSISTALIPFGIDTKLFRPGLQEERKGWRKELAIPETATVALSPRLFRARYGHHTIISAFAHAIAKSQCDAYLVLKRFDSDDPGYLNEVTAFVAHLGIEDRIRILDQLPYEKLPGYYAMGDFAINFPDYDAFPVTFMECFACQLPVLTKELPAYDSFGSRAYLRFTEAPTRNALERAIFTMLSECYSMKEQMAEARSFACANFDETVVARSLSQAYQNIVGR